MCETGPLGWTTADAPALDEGEFGDTISDHTVWSCAGSMTAVRSIRSRVREFLTEARGASSGRPPIPRTVLDDTELATSELATNALLHSRSGEIGGVMTLFLRLDAQRLRVAVADQGHRSVAEPHPLRAGEDTFGRGQLIVDSCTSRSGEYHTEASHVAWFEIDLVPQTPDDGEDGVVQRQGVRP
ncbi:ATP-binding protein [Lipingzhangella sp. LS1_29]|uniref:ATP-binding protein n=1 Tax=Lipingzhangella rawalii TaxID=2055835 RepID=A0ABU2HBX1_9ACTN|nr:ATP-binding protein [Lipingzhangella rawalii]MDS1272492.1 ATP-binding protein [Lipingzhangella rawalii]